MEIPEEWLQAINRKFRSQNIHPKERPELALMEFSKEFKYSFTVTSEISNAVISWFKKNTRSDSHAISELYRGAFYFDACFWPVDIEYGFGQLGLPHPLNSLTGIPINLKQEIKSSKDVAFSFGCLWIDCFDYAWGYEDLLIDESLNSLAISFLKSADKELRATASLLLQDKLQAKAIETARFATEIYLKAVLIAENGWKTEEDLKAGLKAQLKSRFSRNKSKDLHCVDSLIALCIDSTNSEGLRLMQGKLNFPPVKDRYSGKEWEPEYLWYGYTIAQSIAATVMRMQSAQDSRGQIQRILQAIMEF